MRRSLTGVDVAASRGALTARGSSQSRAPTSTTARTSPTARPPPSGRFTYRGGIGIARPHMATSATRLPEPQTASITPGQVSYRACSNPPPSRFRLLVSATAYPRNRDQTKASRSSEGWNPVGQRRDPVNMVAMARSASVIRDRRGDCRGAVDCRELRHGLLVVVVIPYTCGGHPQVCWLHEDFITVKFRIITDLLVKSVP